MKELPELNATLERYDINTPLRVAHFFAQVAHESACLMYNEEIAAGTMYEGRKDLGNTEPGDGVRFKGRGYIQLTGRSNYKEYGEYVGDDLLAFPDRVANKYAMDVSGWYWYTRGINKSADRDSLGACTRKVNGGLNGLNSRAMYLRKAKGAMFID
jgi:putative chitinase